jgi:hypothetical protein
MREFLLSGSVGGICEEWNVVDLQRSNLILQLQFKQTFLYLSSLDGGAKDVVY